LGKALVGRKTGGPKRTAQHMVLANREEVRKKCKYHELQKKERAGRPGSKGGRSGKN